MIDEFRCHQISLYEIKMDVLDVKAVRTTPLNLHQKERAEPQNDQRNDDDNDEQQGAQSCHYLQQTCNQQAKATSSNSDVLGFAGSHAVQDGGLYIDSVSQWRAHTFLNRGRFVFLHKL